MKGFTINNILFSKNHLVSIFLLLINNLFLKIMKKIICLLFIFLLASCSDAKLPENFVGKYVDYQNPSNTIEIINTKGEFIEKEGNGCEVKGKFEFVDESAANKQPWFHITGFKFYESNNSCADGIHYIGATDYSAGGAVIQEGVWDQAGPNNVQAIRFSSYGSIIGALYFKK